MKFAFHDYVQACFLMSRQVEEDDEVLIPGGLFTPEIASRVKIAAEHLKQTHPNRLMLCMARLGWAKQAQLNTDNVSAKQRIERMNEDADLWDKYIECINWLESRREKVHKSADMIDMLSQVQTTLEQSI